MGDANHRGGLTPALTTAARNTRPGSLLMILAHRRVVAHLWARRQALP